MPLEEVLDEAEFYPGTRLRVYGAGLNGVKAEADYYEYLLVDYPDNENEPYMLLVNSSRKAGRYKAGQVLCYVQRATHQNWRGVTGAALKYSVGTTNVFVTAVK